MYDLLLRSKMPLPKVKVMKSIEGDISVPSVGFGTWAATNAGWCHDATLHALKAGYRHLDCAWYYGVGSSYLSHCVVPEFKLFDYLMGC